MAERRMFAKTIIDSDAFLDMPATAQLLYFHLSMRADDDGFINNPKSIIRNVRCSEDDLKMLAIKKFIIPFDSGIVVIKHWKIHNYIAKDRYTETKYKEEKAMLSLDENKSYSLSDNPMYTECIQPVYELDTQDRLGKDSKDKDKKEKVVGVVIDENNAFKLVANCYENNIGQLSSTVMETIKYYLDEGVEAELIIEAIKVACMNNSRRMSYAEAVLKNWLKEGINTIAKYKASLVEKESEKTYRNRDGDRNENDKKARIVEYEDPETGEILRKVVTS